jgi:acetyl/propionyl-CoA carboxylase alpha subunit
MLKAKVNNKYDFSIDGETEKGIDLIEVKQGIFHIIKDNKSYNAEVLKANHEEKNFVIRVNGNKYTVQLKDKYDDLLKELGIEGTSAKKVKELKAPMPGLVVDIRVNEGDEIKKGDALVVLQAMKMENILKSPADAIIKKIHVKKEDTIEKNQILISFN